MPWCQPKPSESGRCMYEIGEKEQQTWMRQSLKTRLSLVSSVMLKKWRHCIPQMSSFRTSVFFKRNYRCISLFSESETVKTGWSHVEKFGKETFNPCGHTFGSFQQIIRMMWATISFLFSIFPLKNLHQLVKYETVCSLWWSPAPSSDDFAKTSQQEDPSKSSCMPYCNCWAIVKGANGSKSSFALKVIHIMMSNRLATHRSWQNSYKSSNGGNQWHNFQKFAQPTHSFTGGETY